MNQGLRVIQIGLGSIGLSIVRILLETPGIKLVGACDAAPEKAGKDLATLLGLPKSLRLPVEGDWERLLRKSRAELAIVSTTSHLKDVKPLLAGLLKRKLHVITTSEELAYPTPAHQGGFRELDRLARSKKATLLAAGVNPGFSMDLLPLMLTGPCLEVRRVSATRVVDLATRRISLQRKVGAGLNVQQFRRALGEGNVRHVGLVESAHMVAGALGWTLERVEETVEPAIAPRELNTEYLRVPAGAVAGIKQFVRAYRNGDLIVSLDLQMYVGAESPRDHILIDGTPPIDMTISGGIAGDTATAAITVNAIPRVLQAPPGVWSMKDLPLVHQHSPERFRTLLATR
jgi:2,4-diaminopentanoate dehydrogenase